MKKKIIVGLVIVFTLVLLSYVYFRFIFDERSHYVTSEIVKLERILKDEHDEIRNLLDKKIDIEAMKSLNEFTNGFNRSGRIDKDYAFKDVPYYEVNSYYLYQIMETDLIPMFYVDDDYNVYYFDGERKK